MESRFQIVITTCADKESAHALALDLVAESLAACVNIVPGVESVYRWQGAVESDSEYLLWIKSTVSNYAAIERRIKALHTYELPEIIAVPITDGSAEYLAWVDSVQKS